MPDDTAQAEEQPQAPDLHVGPAPREAADSAQTVEHPPIHDAQRDPKDKRIAELEAQLEEANERCEGMRGAHDQAIARLNAANRKLAAIRDLTQPE